MAGVLLGKGADADKAAEDGITPLYAASLEGMNGVVELLLAKGADVDKAAEDGATPLIVASEEGMNGGRNRISHLHVMSHRGPLRGGARVRTSLPARVRVGQIHYGQQRGLSPDMVGHGICRGLTLAVRDAPSGALSVGSSCSISGCTRS
jgi:hypothetical protein